LNFTKKAFLGFLVFTLALLFVTPSTPYASAASAGINLNVKSAIMVEASTGKILFKMNESEALPPASMTKMMTELLVLEAIKNGTKKWDDKVKTSEYGHFMGRYGGSRVYLGMGEERTIKELYEAMAIYSANDATVMLAETLAGTEENFVKMMNQKAQELGMQGTHFVTSSGFPAEELGEFSPSDTSEHVMSAKDAAILAREIITKFPEALQISSIPKKWFREGESGQVKMDNWNWMLPELVYGYEGVDGLKTGHTDAAGYCFTGTAERNGIRLITVVMGAGSEAERFGETRKLLDYGFSNFKMLSMLPKGQTIDGFEKAEVKKGTELSVEAVPEKEMVLPVRVGDENNYKPVVKFNEVMAPVEKGQAIGKVTVEYTGQDGFEFLRPGDEQAAQINMVANQEVEKASWIRLFFRAINQFIGGIFGGIVDTISGWF